MLHQVFDLLRRDGEARAVRGLQDEAPGVGIKGMLNGPFGVLVPKIAHRLQGTICRSPLPAREEHGKLWSQESEEGPAQLTPEDRPERVLGCWEAEVQHVYRHTMRVDVQLRTMSIVPRSSGELTHPCRLLISAPFVMC